MKRIAILLLTALLLSGASCLAEPLRVVGTQGGEWYAPEGADPETATYVYRCSYPLLDESDGVAVMINDHFAYMVADAEAFRVPIDGGMLAGLGKSSITVNGEVTCNSDQYFSVFVTTVSDQAGSRLITASGHTFPRSGAKAGVAISLPRLLGILEDEESDEWLMDRQTAKANRLVWRIVWNALQTGDYHLFDDLTEEEFQQMFFPEYDFYLDENGDPVFFHHGYMFCQSETELLYFPITLAYLKDEL